MILLSELSWDVGQVVRSVEQLNPFQHTQKDSAAADAGCSEDALSVMRKDRAV